MINSPNNPTGWTLARDHVQAILAHCRHHGIWIVADDVYERLYYAGEGCAPSFLDFAAPADRLLSTNSFSKAWLMTGWRLGWIVAAAGADARSRQAHRIQHILFAGLCAARRSRSAPRRRAYRGANARTLPGGAGSAGTRIGLDRGCPSGPPPGAMYVFFRIAGVTYSLRSASAWCAKRGWASHRAVRSGPKAKASCAGASPPVRERLLDGVRRLRGFLAPPLSQRRRPRRTPLGGQPWPDARRRRARLRESWSVLYETYAGSLGTRRAAGGNGACRARASGE